MYGQPRNQTTIADQVSVSGFGFWSGRDVKLTFVPAKANTGVVFVRTDLPGKPRIPAVIQNRANGPRRTTLVASGTTVEMVEHVLAALAGLRIDNCEIHVDRAEMPGCDGSSLAFTDALAKTHTVELPAKRRTIRIEAPVRVGTEDSWIQAEPTQNNELELTYRLAYDCPSVGQQTFSSLITPEKFVTEISAARTFLLLKEAQQLAEQGIGQRVTYQDVVVFDDDGPLENKLRFENECARHKLLDMVGDFSLVGADLAGKITAYRSGHRLNSQMAFALLQQIVTTNPARMSA